jgi:hypothetical protein
VVNDDHSWEGDEDEEDADEDEEPPPPGNALYPDIRLTGPRRFELQQWISHPTLHPDPNVECIDIVGPMSDDVLPIILDGLRPGVYVRTDVASFLRPHMGASQRLIPTRCDGEMLPYHALVDVNPAVQLQLDWPSQACDEGPDFEDNETITHPIFPDCFDPTQGVHFAANYGNLFLTMVVWVSLRKRFPVVKDWLTHARIVVDSAL